MSFRRELPARIVPAEFADQRLAIGDEIDHAVEQGDQLLHLRALAGLDAPPRSALART